MPKLGPAAGASSGRMGRSRRVSTSLAEINVVPLVDVMLVLLVIFMVTAPMMQRGVDVKLPTSRRASPITLERVIVTVPLSFRSDQKVRLGDEDVRITVLAERVRQTMLTQTNKQVFLRLDAGVTAQEFMNVIDRLKEAGVENIGLPTDFPR
jgi:biopolymer transport protein ExbD/biopolymer transport protein TolR